jgi:hypothetical protein
VDGRGVLDDAFCHRVTQPGLAISPSSQRCAVLFVSGEEGRSRSERVIVALDQVVSPLSTEK